MAKKNTAKYNSEDIKNLKNDKPIVYTIDNKNGNVHYVGVAKRGRVVDRIKEHLGEIPGSTVKIKQFSSIVDAEEYKAKQIGKVRPRYNKSGKLTIRNSKAEKSMPPKKGSGGTGANVQGIKK